MLSEQDIVVFLELFLEPAEDISSVRLAAKLGISQPQVYRAIRRGEQSRILTLIGQPKGNASQGKRLNRQALYEVLAFGVPYFFPAYPGPLERGVPTAGSAPILAKKFSADPEPLVWPHPRGLARGMSVIPLHRNVPEIALRDERLYELLALVDAVRVGRARERMLARDLLGSLIL